MEAVEIQEVCRLCPSDKAYNTLINVFSNSIRAEIELTQVIFVTTGIQISKNDFISKKICQRCCNITLNMYKFRQDALKKDRALKETYQLMLTRVGNTSVTAKNGRSSSLLSSENPKISECDIISKKICNNCYDNVVKVYDIRQAAFKQDQDLKKKCHQYLSNTGIRLPNSCITIRKESHGATQETNKKTTNLKPPLTDIDPKPPIELPCDGDLASCTPTDTIVNINLKRDSPNKKFSSNSLKRYKFNEGLHPSIIGVYRKYPTFKLPGKCFNQNLAPIVSLVMGEVETHFKKRGLDMLEFIAKPTSCTPLLFRSKVKQVARKRTAVPFKKPSLDKSLNSVQNLDATNNSLSKSLVINTDDNVVFSEFISDMSYSNRYVPDETSRPSAKSSSELTKRIRKSKKTKNPIVLRQQKMRFSKLKSLCNSLKAPFKKVPKVSKPYKPKSFSPSPSAPKCSTISNEAALAHPSTSGIKYPNISEATEGIPSGPCQSQNSSPLYQTTKDKQGSKVRHEHRKPGPVKKSVSKGVLLNAKSLVKKISSRSLKSEQLQRTSKNEKSNSISMNNSALYDEVNLSGDQSKLRPECHLTLAGLKDHVNPLHMPARSIAPSVIPTTIQSSLPNTSKPEFIESLGLTPALSLSHTSNSFLCKLCGCQHSTSGALNKHMTRHRTCPFCKIKFKYGENKEIHIENNCKAKRMVQTSDTALDPQTIKSNYQLGNSTDVYKLSQGLSESDSVMDADNVIVLTDDEEIQLIESGDESPEIFDNVELEAPHENSVSIVKPIISICNNTILDRLGNILTDTNFVKKLTAAVRRASIPMEENGSQTESVVHQDPILIKNQSCLLKSLNYDLISYMVPINIKNGNFKVSFRTKYERKKADSSADWTSLPLTNKYTGKAVNDIPIMNTTYPLTFLTSQVQSSQLSLSSIQLMTTTTPTMSIFLPNAQSFLPSTSVSIQPNLNNTTVPHTQAINNTFFSPIQTTPLLQNYTLSMTPLPIINNQVSVQTSNSSDQGTKSVSNNPVQPSAKPKKKSKVIKTSSAVTTGPSTNFSENNDSKIRICRNQNISSPFQSKKINGRKAIRRKQTHKKQQRNKVARGNVSQESPSSSKLRVKNIWELK